MKTLFTFIILWLICPIMINSLIAQEMGSGGWRLNEKQIRIPADNPDYVKRVHELKLNFDFYGPSYDHIIAYVIPDELDRIRAYGIPYVIEVEDLNSYYENFWAMDEAYHTYQQVINLADSLETAFPSICKKYIFGYSIQNRQCVALKISDNVLTDEPEPEVMFDGGIHGDEIGGPENLIRFARDLCTQYGTNPTITTLVNTREIWLYLMDNPDGRYNMSRYNANGVDLNRDWAYMWDAWGGSSGPCSQIESKNLRNCMYNNQFVVHTTYHSGTEFISCPWSYRPNQPLDWNHIIQLAGLYSSVSGYSYLDFGQGYNGMYAINGSTKDGNYGMMGAISWSIEISYSKQPPTSQIMQYYNWNYPSMMMLIEYAGYGLEGIVTDAVTSAPVRAAVFVNNYYPTYTDPIAGDYHKYVLPGTYSITVVANGYQSQTINNVIVTASSSIATNFQLQPADNYFAYKFAASQIPDNNYSDEGLTYAALGPPDNVNYSIGKNGWCVLDMQYPIPDLAGADFTVYEGDTSPEGYYCYVGQTIDGPWISLGSATGTTQFDLSGSGLTEAQFIRILDDNDGVANAPDAGFDLDAIAALSVIPVELISFTANVNDGQVTLSWATATETNNRGFEIERYKESKIIQEDWESISFVEGQGTKTEVTQYTLTDKKVGTGKYLYRLKQIDYDGSFEYSKVVEVEVNKPEEFALHQNYPNPFNPSTKIKFSIPNNVILSGAKNLVTLKIYDVLGNEIATLVNEEKPAGNYEVEFSASGGLPSGVYYYKLQAGNFVQTRKMVLIK